MKNFQQTPKQRRIDMTNNKHAMASCGKGKSNARTDEQARLMAAWHKEANELRNWIRSIRIS